MTKHDFLLLLQQQLSVLAPMEREEYLSFYREMIEDRMEEGLPEAEAVAAMGSVYEIAAQILPNVPVKAEKDQKKQAKREKKTGKTLLLILGSPLWIVLLMAGFAVLLALFAALWCVVICLWAAFAAVAVSSIAAAVGGTIFLCTGNTNGGLALLCVVPVCMGLSILLFLGCKAATKGGARLTGKTIGVIKKLFFGGYGK